MKLILLCFLYFGSFLNAYSLENNDPGIISDDVIPVGEVHYLRGTAYRNGTQLDKGSNVFEGDTVRTLKSSVVKIKMINESTLTIAPLTEMIIEQFKSEDENLIHLLKGVMRAKVTNNPANKENSLIVKSDTAALGVRGTDFQFTYNKKNRVSSLLTYEGSVAFRKISSSKFSYDDLDSELSKNDSFIVNPGEFSANNLKTGALNSPTRISVVQFHALRRNNIFKKVKRNLKARKKSNRSIIPTGAPSRSFSSPPKIKKAIIKKKNKIKADGFYSDQDGAFAPASGGFLDTDTGLYIEPDSKSDFLLDQDQYSPSQQRGSVDSKTGEYMAPKGFKLTPEGLFEPINKKIKNIKPPPVLNFSPSSYEPKTRLISDNQEENKKTLEQFNEYFNVDNANIIQEIKQDIVNESNANNQNQSNTTQVLFRISEQ